MTEAHTELKPNEPSRRMLAEASAWLARLHRPHRLPEDEAGFRRWLAEQPGHIRAWELAIEMWEVAQRIPLSALSDARAKSSSHSRPRGWHLTLVSAVALVIFVVMLPQVSGPLITTGVGERRVVTLDDGSSVSLNTSTRLSLRFSEEARRVRLLSGEAMFEVAKEEARPFIVEAGGREITAHGTSFVVRRDGERLAVTLLEGRISVANTEPTIELPTIDPIPQPQWIKPGERLIFADEAEPRRDRPPLDTVTAWQRGVAIFDNTPLIDAANEMNRYNSATALKVDDGAVASLPVSGVFRLGDSTSFARAVAHGYGLNIRESDGRIELVAGNWPTPQRPP